METTTRVAGAADAALVARLHRDQIVDCRRFRVLNIVDDHSRFCPGQIVDVSISGARMARFLDDLALRYGLPEEIVLDNGPEGTSRAMFDWSEKTGVRLRFIEPGKPVQNAFVESLDGKLRDECLNLHWFRSIGMPGIDADHRKPFRAQGMVEHTDRGPVSTITCSAAGALLRKTSARKLGSEGHLPRQIRLPSRRTEIAVSFMDTSRPIYSLMVVLRSMLGPGVQS